MKKQINRVVILTIIMLTFGTQVCYSQVLGGCANNQSEEDPYNNSESTYDYQSDAWLKYRDPSYWIPEYSDPVKTILINYIICRKDDGTGGWVDNEEFRAEVDQMILELNNRFSNIPHEGYTVE